MIAAIVTGLAMAFEQQRGPGNAVKGRGRLVLADGTLVQWRSRKHRVVDAMAALPLRAPVTLSGWLRVAATTRKGQPLALVELDAEQVLSMEPERDPEPVQVTVHDASIPEPPQAHAKPRPSIYG